MLPKLLVAVFLVAASLCSSAAQNVTVMPYWKYPAEMPKWVGLSEQIRMFYIPFREPLQVGTTPASTSGSCQKTSIFFAINML